MSRSRHIVVPNETDVHDGILEPRIRVSGAKTSTALPSNALQIGAGRCDLGFPVRFLIVDGFVTVIILIITVTVPPAARIGTSARRIRRGQRSPWIVLAQATLMYLRTLVFDGCKTSPLGSASGSTIASG